MKLNIKKQFCRGHSRPIEVFEGIVMRQGMFSKAWKLWQSSNRAFPNPTRRKMEDAHQTYAYTMKGPANIITLSNDLFKSVITICSLLRTSLSKQKASHLESDSWRS